MKIKKYLLKNGIEPRYKGFRILEYAIELCRNVPRYLDGFSKWLYPDIANDLGISRSKVEKSMRDAIKFSGSSQTISKFISKAVLEIGSKKKGVFMTINYSFNDNYFDYEVEYDRYLVALHNILLKEDKESLIEIIINSDACIVNLEEDYKEELKEYFREMAYKEYLDGRDS